jgi:hypothetical protein
MLERSETCANIITDLQNIKKDVKNLSYDKCKLDLLEHMDWVRKNN